MPAQERPAYPVKIPAGCPIRDTVSARINPAHFWLAFCPFQSAKRFAHGRGLLASSAGEGA